MKNKYIHVISDGVMSNKRLSELNNTYNIISTFNSRGKVIYLLKKKNIFARLINKIF